MGIFDDLTLLKRRLLRCEVNLDSLPPFALSPEQIYDLKSDARLLGYSLDSQSPEALRARSATDDMAVELTTIDDTGIFTVHGLRCVQADRLGA